MYIYIGITDSGTTDSLFPKYENKDFEENIKYFFSQFNSTLVEIKLYSFSNGKMKFKKSYFTSNRRLM